MPPGSSATVSSHLHVVRLIRLVVQLHHGLVLSDHTRRGGLPSAGHDDGRPWVPLGGTAALTWSLRAPSADATEAEEPRMQDYCHYWVWRTAFSWEETNG